MIRQMNKKKYVLFGKLIANNSECMKTRMLLFLRAFDNLNGSCERLPATKPA